jgi:DNA replication protein DnaC
VLISGPTGSGKSWLACALAQHACRRGHSALYLRVPRLAEELRILHGNGGFATWLAALARTDVLILDDWALAPLETSARADLLEMIDDRAGTRPTILTTQLPVEHWHSWIGDPTIADAILDRLLAREHRITLKGESLRTGRARSSRKGALETEP